MLGVLWEEGKGQQCEVNGERGIYARDEDGGSQIVDVGVLFRY